jgi:hypothetical protein
MFTPALLSFFEMFPPERKWHIEGSGFTLLAYRANLTVPPPEIRAFLEETCDCEFVFCPIRALPAESERLTAYPCR